MCRPATATASATSGQMKTDSRAGRACPAVLSTGQRPQSVRLVCSQRPALLCAPLSRQLPAIPCPCREGNDPGHERTVTYKEMLDMTGQVGNAMSSICWPQVQCRNSTSPMARPFQHLLACRLAATCTAREWARATKWPFTCEQACRCMRGWILGCMTLGQERPLPEPVPAMAHVCVHVPP